MGGENQGRLGGGLRTVHAYVETHDGNTKRAALLVLTAFILLWWLAFSLYGLVNLSFSLFVFASLAVLVSLIGVYAAWKRRRPLLFVYILGVVVVMGFVAVGLVIVMLTGIITLSLSFNFLIAILIDVAVLIIKGFSVVLAYSLAKDLDPKRVMVLGSSGASGEQQQQQQQEFSFSEGGGAVEMHTVGVQPSNAPHHQHTQMAMATPALGVYNPVTGTFGQPQLQPQSPPVGYPVAPFHPYGYPSQGMGGYAAADMATVGFVGDRYDLPLSQPIYENDIIGDAVLESTTGLHSDTTKLMAQP